MTQKLIPAFKTGVNEDMFIKEDLDIFKKFSEDLDLAALEVILLFSQHITMLRNCYTAIGY